MKIENNVNLKSYNTLQVPVTTKYLVRIRNESDIFELIVSDLFKTEKHCILNGWSNILFTNNFDWIVIKIETKWKRIITTEGDSVLVEAEAWENWSDFVEWICENNLYWIENLIDIPGNVGTAPVSNIWAYGVEVSDYIYEVEWIELNTWEKRIFKRSECEFSYRMSIFKHTLKFSKMM